MAPTTLLLAKLLGPLFLIVGISIFLNRSSFENLMKEAEKSSLMIYFSGVLAFLGGLAVVLNQNVWILTIDGAVTLLAWLALVKGVVSILFPSLCQQMIAKKRELIALQGVLALAIGIWFTWAAYFAV